MAKLDWNRSVTVGELIEALSRCDPDWPVYLDDTSHELRSVVADLEHIGEGKVLGRVTLSATPGIDDPDPDAIVVTPYVAHDAYTPLGHRRTPSR